MRTLFCCVLASTSFILPALAKESHSFTNSEAKIERMLRASGGLVARPDTYKGSILVLNAQKRISTADISLPAIKLAKLMRINVKTLESDMVTISEINILVNKNSANAFVVVIDDTSWKQRLTYFPDENVSVVNVAALSLDDPKPKMLIARVSKEIARGLCYSCGAGASSIHESLMGAKNSVADLDQLVQIEFPMDVVPRMRTYLNSLGVTPLIQVPYIRACREGWANDPTNEYQKAIWDKVHQLPTEPIKIKPETTKITE